MIDVVPMYEPRYYERSAQRHMARYLQNCLFINAPWGLSGNPASRPEIDAEAGNCSLSLAPMRTEDRTRHADVFSYIEDIPPGAGDSTLLTRHVRERGDMALEAAVRALTPAKPSCMACTTVV